MQEYGDTWTHKLPRVEMVPRNDYLVELSRGKTLTHIGFWGTEGSRERQLDGGTWLHKSMADVATKIVGIDHNEVGIEEARAQGYEAYFADAMSKAEILDLGVEPAQLVVAGEIIEHVERPGDFLDALHPLVADDGMLVLTTPNAYRLTNVFATLAGREMMNPDHIAIYSWFTLTNLLERHDWDVAWFKTYDAVRRGRRATRVANGVQRLASKRFPFLASGLIVGCSPSQSASRAAAS